MSNVLVGNTLTDMYAKCGNLGMARMAWKISEGALEGWQVVVKQPSLCLFMKNLFALTI